MLTLTYSCKSVTCLREYVLVIKCAGIGFTCPRISFTCLFEYVLVFKCAFNGFTCARICFTCEQKIKICLKCDLHATVLCLCDQEDFYNQ